MQTSDYKFYPHIYYKFVDNYSRNKEAIDFPPNGDPNFIQINQYEDMKYLQKSKRLNVTSDDYALVFSTFMKPQWRD